MTPKAGAKTPASSFLKVLQTLRGRTVISFHSRADPDAVASALALSLLVPRSVVRAPDEVDSSAKNLLSSLGYGLKAFNGPAELSKYSNLVLVDVSSAALLGQLSPAVESFAGSVFVVDHHLHGQRMKCKGQFIVKHSSSCAEVVLDLWRAARRKPPSGLSTLMLCAAISDSADLASANKETFGNIAYLLGCSGLDYPAARALVIRPPDISEKLATLKAVGGCTLARTKGGKFIVATASTNSFELSCAQALVASGADVGFACNPSKGRISGVKRETLPPTVSIGRMMEAAGRTFRGSGGGHENAGGARGSPSRSQQALGQCVKEALAQLEGLEKQD